MTGAEAAGADEAGRTVVPELSAVADLIGSAVVDGMPVLLARSEGPVSGGLVFRVGWADEPLARRGVTHLVEHLALFGQNLSDLHHNGATDEWATQFHATGSVAKVVAFLNGVCAALRDLPLDRMEVEKGILAAEAARGSGHAFDRLRVERYGVRGPGGAGYEGFGLPAVSAADVATWVGERFTRGNAVAWITTDVVPDGLDLRLPEGPQWPVPELSESIGAKPAYFFGPPGVVVLDAVVPATTAGTAFSYVASRALFRSLRQEGGLSYDARCDWERIGPGHARVTVSADALPEKQAEAVGEIIDVLAALRAGRIDQAELDNARGELDDLRGVPFLGAHLLPSAAYKLAAGIETRSPEQSAADFAAVTVDDVADMARQVWTGAVAQIPEGDLDWAGFTLVPVWSNSAVSGTAHERVGHNHGTLIVGSEGVTVQEAEGVVTVRFADAEALEVWPDGARRLIGADGFRILIEPALHVGITPDVIASIDAGVPADRHVPRPARAAHDIPARPQEQPSAPAPPAASAQARRGWMFYLGVAIGAFALGMAGLVVGDAVHLAVPYDDGTLASPGTVLGGVILTSIPALTSAVLILADSRRRAKRGDGAR
ncbi:hypothetical protein [Microbacterium sp. CFBP9034]|uniref:hypothetical protein n=1 Tax=Microbacterium sp. CFBP9034 TaxID=3096540 RepID=UPI002A6B54F0|nr:hypothetical protein [Microbacterium sp. CFBP9034]MDY0909101.1 hypothetical protein [Microbacterium sp. CFBP9034]